ncbi:MAG TPA: autotransporter-associated beta strand repeat-containing protein, partial [Tepidisphaeraceae bacterium]|nr:autotransporter-associated beta strand repeat-containing protein [Tepidisphaeraceae bacterium]
MINTNASTGAGLRATGTFSTGRLVTLAASANAIEVTAGNVLTLSNFSATGNALTKNDGGVLALTGDNSAWSGAITINAGAIRAGHSNALGTSGITIPTASPYSALQLSGGVNVANSITIGTLTGGVQFSGIDSGGAVQSVSGVNTYSGTITHGNFTAPHLGADAGATLNFTGSINNTTALNSFGLQGAGTINLNPTSFNGTGINKFGTGTTTFGAAAGAYSGTAMNLVVNQGTFAIAGNGAVLGGTGTATVNPSATLTVDDSVGAPTANRLNGRAVTVSGGTFNYIGNAANSSETAGILTLGGPVSIVSTPSGAATNTLTFASLTSNTGASGTFSGTGLGTASNAIKFTAPPTLAPVTTGILARYVVTSGGGFDFATYDAALGVKAFAGYTAPADINTAAVADTVSVTNATVTALTGSRTVNAIKMTGGGVNISGATGNTLTLTSGGVIVTGGGAANTISVPTLNLGAVEGAFHVNAGSTLNVTSLLTGSAGLTKADGGTMTVTGAASAVAGVTASSLTGGLWVNGGTLKLGSNNAFVPNTGVRISPGATLDLNGFGQSTAQLFTDAAVAQTTPGQQGTITSSTGSGTLVTNQNNAAQNWAGRITGAVTVLRGGQNTLSLFSDNDYTGATILAGGTTTLRDMGRLSATTSIDVNNATFVLDNNVGTVNSNNRVNDAANLTLRSGSLTYVSRLNTASSETLGQLRLAEGTSEFQTTLPTVTAGAVGSLEMTFAQLVQTSPDATINMRSANAAFGSGNRVKFTTAPVLKNNIVGAWVEYGGNDWATYVPDLGLVTLGTAGAPAYDSTSTLPAANAPTQNVKITSTQAVGAGGLQLNTLIVNGAFDLNFANNTALLNLTMGGLLKTGNNATKIGATPGAGQVTAGGAGAPTGLVVPLYVHSNSNNTTTLNANIVDNPNGDDVRLVAVMYNGVTMSLAGTGNTYTGGTAVNGWIGGSGTFQIASGGVLPAGGLTITNATVNQLAGGVIDSANVVTMNGGSTLNLNGNNSLAGLAFRNLGGATNPTVNTFGTLTLNGGVTVTDGNPTVPSVIAGRVSLPAVNVWNIGALELNGFVSNPLGANAVVQGMVGAGGINKTGAGVLQMNAPGTYAGATLVTAGGLRIGAANAGSRHSALTIGAAGRLDLNSFQGVFGSLTGSGIVFNSALGANTLA